MDSKFDNVFCAAEINPETNEVNFKKGFSELDGNLNLVLQVWDDKVKMWFVTYAVFPGEKYRFVFANQESDDFFFNRAAHKKHMKEMTR